MSDSIHTYGTAITLTANAFTRTGYTFLGWSTSSSATSAAYTDGQSVKNLTSTDGAIINLYAVWKANTYTVKYNANGGSGSMSNSSHTYDVEKTLTANAFTRSGYTFLGWSTSSSATSATYTNSQSVKNLTSTDGGTVNLYAVWNKNEASAPTASLKSTNDLSNSQTVTINMYDNEGVFAYYWGTNSAYKNNEYQECSSISTSIEIEKVVDKAGTYYLTVVDVSGNVSITCAMTFYKTTLNANGGSVSISSVLVKSGNNITLPTPNRTGYSYAGWSTSSSATTGSSVISSKSNTTYYAVWKANTYTVKYNANGGSGSMSNSSHTYDVSKALTTNAFTRTGYTFLGWSTSSSATSATYTDSQSVKNLASTNGAIINLYAVWHKHSYTSKITTNATCSTNGVRTYTCSGCGDSYTETIAAPGHNWTAATCTSKKTCSVCKSTSGEPLGHSYTSKVTKAATCTTSGIKTLTCSKCSNSYTETIPTTEHNYISIVVSPTCVSNGYTVHKCIVCEYSFSDTVTDKLSHSFNDWYTITAVSCNANGVERHDCSVCGFYETNEIPTQGHSYSNGVCQNCGDDKTATCSCNCHKSGIMKIIFKIVLIFQKIFRQNKECSCGIYHY